MKILERVVFTSLTVLALAMPVQAASVVWDRNTESDMKDYQVWACFFPNCIVTKTPTMLQGTVVQPAFGTQPTFTMDLVDKEGAVAVSARDLTLNESGLSVQVPFDKKAPTTPTGIALQ